MTKKETINDIIKRNGFEDEIDNPTLQARVVLAAWGVAASSADLNYPTLDLIQDGKVVVKVKMPPCEMGWFDGFGDYIYESQRVANVVGRVVDFEAGIFKGNTNELGLKNGEFVLGYDFNIEFDEIKLGSPLPSHEWVEVSVQ